MGTLWKFSSKRSNENCVMPLNHIIFHSVAWWSDELHTSPQRSSRLKLWCFGLWRRVVMW